MDRSLAAQAFQFGTIALLFFGLWLFRSPRTARLGNLAAATALLLAVVAVPLSQTLGWWPLLAATLAAGGLLGWLVAARVTMVQIPALVALQHGAGGVAAVVVSYVEIVRSAATGFGIERISGLLGIILGAATFSGSLIASGKLAGVLGSRPTQLPGHVWLTLALTTTLGVVLGLVGGWAGTELAWGGGALVLLAAGLGLLVAVRIGGADMPVLISLLNASAGLAAALCGVVLGHRLLVAWGAAVTASGSLLTWLMCRAMNRSLWGVLSGLQHKAAPAQVVAAEVVAAEVAPAEVAPAAAATSTDEPSGTAGRAAAPIVDPLGEAVRALRSGHRVVVVPGYGMALAQAQFEVVRLVRQLMQRKIEVRFAIHPVAGRMPGHMNVLLAEADADYEQMLELDEANSWLADTDVALVVGACDVVNPAAVRSENTPISGMPILRAFEARRVVVCNLDERPGYSGVENLLYRSPGVVLLLGDAQQTVRQLNEGLEATA